MELGKDHQEGEPGLNPAEVLALTPCPSFLPPSHSPPPDPLHLL